MFRTIEEGFKIYQEFLVTFVKKANELEKKYGIGTGCSLLGYMSYSGADYAWALENMGIRKGMEMALGISESQAKEYILEVEKNLEEVKETLSKK